jgi:glycosyltransferase involved in cell wall biosynthesis
MEARLLRESGFEVTVITSAVHYMTGKFIGSGRGWCREEMCEGIRILRVWTIPDYRRSIARRILNYSIFALLAAVAAVLKVRKRLNCLFTATDPLFFMPFLLIVAAIKRVPVVLDERDLFPDTAIALGIVREGWLTRLVFAVQQASRRRATSLLTATPGIKRRLVAHGHDPDRIHVLLNADPYLNVVERPKVPEAVMQYRSRYRCLIGYAGTLGQADDVETIIRTATELKHRNDMGFLIVGGGERYSEYVDLARKLELQHLLFLGPIPRGITRAILAQCDLGLQAVPPDQFFTSTLTSKTFDYMGLGVPVIFAGAGDTADLLRESGAGIAVTSLDATEMAAAVIALSDDDARRERMARAANDWYASHISISNCLGILRTAIPLNT